ncbi:unnamed protein product, partial [Closterium sp. NIES-65]
MSDCRRTRRSCRSRRKAQLPRFSPLLPPPSAPLSPVSLPPLLPHSPSSPLPSPPLFSSPFFGLTSPAAAAMQAIATTWPSATTSWVSGETCDTWLGVVCDDNGFVTQLTLGRNELTGSIPTGYSQLQKLRFLRLKGGCYSPIDILSPCRLHPPIASLSSYPSPLYPSDLSKNRLSVWQHTKRGHRSPLPLSFPFPMPYPPTHPSRGTPLFPSDLSKNRLDLSKNRLSGSIPKEVIALPNLMYFTAVVANPPPPPPPPPPEDPDKRKPGLKDTDYQAVATKPLVNFNKYFRYVSLGYKGTATKPSWTYKTAVDWRTQVVSKQNRTVVGPTVDQGTCAACWALVPVAAIEAAYAIAFGSNQPNISGQHILNCQGTWECVGGLPSDAFQFSASAGVLPEFIVPYTGTKDASSCPRLSGGWLAAAGGVLLEFIVPYTGTKDASSCGLSGVEWSGRMRDGALPDGGSELTRPEEETGRILPSRPLAKKKPPPAPAAQPVPGPYRVAMFEQVAVSGWLGMVIALQAQPIIANIEADQASFIEYTGGYIYADPDCFINGVVNHIVLLVGYSMAGSTPYFLAQNTWGATWGVGGFMQMAITSGCHAHVVLPPAKHLGSHLGVGRLNTDGHRISVNFPNSFPLSTPLHPPAGDGICSINTSPALYPVVPNPNP